MFTCHSLYILQLPFLHFDIDEQNHSFLWQFCYANNIIISDICSYSFPYFSSTVFKGRYYISGVMASIFSLSVVDRGFDSRSGQTKDWNWYLLLPIYAKHAALRSKSKDCLAQNQNNVYEWNGMSTHKLVCQQVSIIKIQLSMLIISTNVTCPHHDMAEKLFIWH